MPITPARADEFKKAVFAMQGSCSIIMAQVDPDAIGAAFGVAHLITTLRPKNGFEIRIFFGGSVSHPQNRAIINRFDLQKRMKSMKQFTEADSHNVILVDSSSVSDGRLQIQGKIEPVIVIDHHRGGDVAEGGGRFIWTEDVGAASTLVVELALALEVVFDDSNQTVAVLLGMGIHTDTGSLTDCSERDRAAYNIVVSAIPHQELAQLFRYPLPQSHFDNVRRALENKMVDNGRLVTHIGRIAPEEGDDLSTIADSLIRMNGVTLVIVWAIVDKVVRISARSADITSPLDIFLRDRLPSNASSGAKLSSNGQGIGGATISMDLGVWMVPETTEEIVSLVSKWIQTKIFQK